MESTVKLVRSIRPLLVSLFAALAIAMPSGPARAVTVDFEDLGATLPPNSAVNDSSGFTSQGVAFNNQFTDFGGGFSTWAGFAWSNVDDAVTPGFGNQFAAYQPGAAAAGGTYAVGAVDSFVPFLPRITFAQDIQALSVRVANTTYAALSMRDGDAFAKQFGGPTRSDPDFFRLQIEGLDAAGDSTGTVEFFLADYRFEEDGLDDIVDAFTTVSLASLGTVRAIEFSLTSSDVGAFGMNTPAYFAIDDLVAVPEPRALLLAGLGIVGLGIWRRRPAGPAAR